MSDGSPPRRVLVAMAVIAILAAAALWLPRWWENRLYRQAEAMTGVGSPVLAGGVTSARGKIEPGKTAAQVVAAIGRPSFSVRTEGTSIHDIWTYYYADGTMTVNLTDEVVKRISLTYGPPKIPTSHRP
jgi:glycosyltransferase involved in cell wall biosynthesis